MKSYKTNRMKQSHLISSVLLASVVGSVPMKAIAQEKSENKPNLIFILTDQWRKQALGFKGEDPVKTPNLDKFASWAVSFDNATSCRPVSGPNRACLFSGKYPINNGVFANSVPMAADEESMGKVYQAAGYQTAYIGKWHLNGMDDHVTDLSGRQGFDYFVQSMGHQPFYQGYYMQNAKERTYIKGWAPTYETKLGIDFIEKQKTSSQPFCLVLSYNPPHTGGGPGFEDRYQPGKLGPDKKVKMGYGYAGPAEYEALYKDIDYAKNPIRENQRTIRRSTDTSAGVIAGYFGAITAIDNDFGNLMNYLEQNGLLDNTIIVFTSDHGESMGSQGLMTKGTWFEESMGVPCLIGWKGVIKPKREKMVFNSIDLMPTLLGLSKLPIPEKVDGLDYSPLLLGKKFKAPEYAFTSFDFGGVAEIKAPRYWRSVYTSRYTYVLCGMNQNREFTKDGIVLYDREKDPLQLNPIYKGMGYDKVIDELHATLIKQLDRTGDPFIQEYWNNNNASYPKLNKVTMDLSSMQTNEKVKAKLNNKKKGNKVKTGKQSSIK